MSPEREGGAAIARPKATASSVSVEPTRSVINAGRLICYNISCDEMSDIGRGLMTDNGVRLSSRIARDSFRQSLVGRPAWLRLIVVVAGLIVFWLAVAWAVAVP